MDTFVNKKNRQFIVKHSMNGVEMEYKTPINKSAKVQLNLRDSSGKTLVLDGMQVRTLMNVLRSGNTLKEHSITSKRKR